MSDSNFVIRLKLFMDALGLSSSQLADKCDIPRPTLSSILSGRSKKISDALIGQIHKVFPQLSVLWLMFNEGEMFLSPSDSDFHDDSSIASEISDSHGFDDFSGSDITNVNSLNSSEQFLSGSSPISFNSLSSDIPETGNNVMRDSLRSQAHLYNRGESVVTRGAFGRTGGPNDSNSGPNSLRENREFPTADPGPEKKSNLNDQNGGKNGPSDRINKGIDGDLRTIALMRQIENMRQNPRKVTQITIYYDDSTFETFFPSRS